MKRFLVVGDPHIKPEDLEEGQRLIDYILDIALDTKPSRIVLMGDLFHTHSIVHVEVMHFWQKAVERLAMLWPVVVLLGNHDGPHDMKDGVHALTALSMIPGVQVVDKPQMLKCTISYEDNDHIAFVPFMRHNDEFVAACNALAPLAKTIYCHQEFDGAKYDNGFYSKHGVQPEAIVQETVISGHIHTGQEFGKVWYVGAPRWMTASDANQDRYIWVIDHDEEGKIVARTSRKTDPACQRIVQVKDTPNAPADIQSMDPSWKVIVDIVGPAAWVKERKDAWRGKARIRTFVEEGKKVVVRESEGISTAFVKYLGGFQSPNGTPASVLEELCRNRLQIER
jgi:DNA repair exonuclease SbcCD nuclease subunit